MTNRIALVLAILILLFFAGDALFNSGRAAFFLATETYWLIDWVAFWR